MGEGDNLRIKSEEIKKLREEKGLSMRKLAKKADIPMSQVSDLENEQLLNTTLETICRIANVLEVEVTKLFTCD